MVALKASWQVRAGLIPGTPMSEYDKTWLYSSLHYEMDGGEQAMMQAEGSHFNALKKQAHDYAASLERGGLNWVTVEYLWL
jgi:hypothetical protein